MLIFGKKKVGTKELYSAKKKKEKKKLGMLMLII